MLFDVFEDERHELETIEEEYEDPYSGSHNCKDICRPLLAGENRRVRFSDLSSVSWECARKGETRCNLPARVTPLVGVGCRLA